MYFYSPKYELVTSANIVNTLPAIASRKYGQIFYIERSRKIADYTCMYDEDVIVSSAG